MTTETILHAYQIIIVPRLNVPAEVYIDPPYTGGGQRYTAHDLDRWIGQLERELEVMRAARTMLEAANTGGDQSC